MKRILVANRGEIACRIIRAAHALDLDAVAVYSDADELSLHVELADAAIRVGPAPASQSYLDEDAILAAATASNADAVHPGYGFLAENSKFASKTEAAGLIWIGPQPETIEQMGDKERARGLAQVTGLPILPGSARFAFGVLEGVAEAAFSLEYPLLIKASAGGGGIGMRRVDSPDQLRKQVEATQALAARSFGDGAIYLERYVRRARHVEIQIFGFGDGRAVHLFERDCSTQRRFQKIIEESPAPGLSDEVVQRMSASAVALASSVKYRGAGTIEFVVDAESGEFYFLEMNTRIQVEHPVTEMICGLDLVVLQLRLAAGEDLFEELSSVTRRGAAVECRIYAENPQKRFLPSPGKLERFDLPQGTANVRVETGVRAGDVITPYYDPMIAKIIVWANDRPQAIDDAITALRQTNIEGPATNRDFLISTLQDPEFQRGRVWTGLVDERLSNAVG